MHTYEDVSSQSDNYHVLNSRIDALRLVQLHERTKRGTVTYIVAAAGEWGGARCGAGAPAPLRVCVCVLRLLQASRMALQPSCGNCNCRKHSEVFLAEAHTQVPVPGVQAPMFRRVSSPSLVGGSRI